MNYYPSLDPPNKQTKTQLLLSITHFTNFLCCVQFSPSVCCQKICHAHHEFLQSLTPLLTQYSITAHQGKIVTTSIDERSIFFLQTIVDNKYLRMLTCQRHDFFFSESKFIFVKSWAYFQESLMASNQCSNFPKIVIVR